MSKPLDRIGYLKSILGSDTTRAEKAVLIYFTVYCDANTHALSVSQHTSKRIGPMLGMTNYTTGKTIQGLKDAKLLTTEEMKVDGTKGKRLFYILPTEDKLAFYTAPKKPTPKK